MKKLLHIFVFLAIVLYSFGYYIVYRCNIQSLKQTMRRAVSRGEFDAGSLVSFEFNTLDASCFKDVEFKEQGKEIRYKGEMYDVVTARLKGQNLVLECIADKDESDIMLGFTRYLSSNYCASSHKKDIRLVKFNFPFFLVASRHVYTAVLSQPKTLFSLYPTTIRSLYYLNKPSPPPWQSVC